jgi:hypothetical protein
MKSGMTALQFPQPHTVHEEVMNVLPISQHAEVMSNLEGLRPGPKLETGFQANKLKVKSCPATLHEGAWGGGYIAPTHSRPRH